MKPLRGTALKRFLKHLEKPPVEVMLLLQDVEDPVNVGSAFRIADAAGVTEMLLTGITATPPHKRIDQVGRGKDKKVKWQKLEDIDAAIATARARGFSPVAVELTEEAKPYTEYAFPERTCLLVGHEDHGVTRRALEQVDGAVFIPMYGKGGSLNVHVALAVVLFHVLHRVPVPTIAD